jgi:hypothetical protein
MPVYQAKSIGSVDNDLFFWNWTRPNADLYVQNPWRTTFTIPEPELEPGQLDDYDVLENWKKQWPTRSSDGLSSGRKPKLVVVATSGGGITAAY